MLLSTLILSLTPTVFFQEPEETKLEAAQRKVAELEAELGPEHLDVAEALDAVMMIHYGQAQYENAEEVCRRTMSIREKSLGSEHTDVSTSLNNLANFLRAQGSYS
ncbi:MAG: tetratricopeptide repeat protein, partial [Planctomycetota bacterium]|nr:tetratricopeptide repeat protein [Planctomycetota bacterium]